jgi:hypothetical protein
VAGIRKQIARNLNLGLDRVALVDIIVHHPTDGIDGAAWMGAGEQALGSLAEMRPALAERLPTDSLAGQFAWSVGSVVGGDERIRGAGAPILLRPVQANSCRARRGDLERGLRKILSALPQPQCWPAAFLDCRACNRIHAMDAVCASQGEAPRRCSPSENPRLIDSGC